MMKNAFYFTLKALSVLKILKFLSLLFGYVKKQLDLKDKVNFKIYGVTAWKINIAIHILPNISRRKGDLIIKFSQLMEYDKSNISRT